MVYKPKSEDLEFITRLLEAGTVVPVIDSQYTLDDVPSALEHFEEGGIWGTVVIAV